MRFLYLTIDGLPTFRPDITALWEKYLPRHGVTSDMVTVRTAGTVNNAALWNAGRAMTIARHRNALLNGLADFANDCRWLWRARRKDYAAIQLRDKTFIGLIALTVARWRGLPFFYWMSFPYGQSLLNLGRTDAVRRDLPRRFYLWWRGRVGDWLLHRIVLQYADHVFVQSERMVNDLAAHGVEHARMTPVPMGIDPDRFPIILPRIDLPGVPAGARVLGYLGEASKARQIDFLINAVAHARASVPDIYLLIVGDAISPEEQAWLRACVADAGLAGCCCITGWVAPDAATATLAASEICLALMAPDPILDSTTPTKLVEYLAIGRPVVANDHPDQSRVVRESEAGIIASYNITDYGSAIVTLLEQKDAHVQMSQKGRAYVLAERAYPAVAARLAAHYEALIGREQL